jgi:hypothetical protein
VVALPPTSDDLRDPEASPYFVWWTPCTVANLRSKLADPDPEVRAYWLGALLREANTRDVWLFTDRETIENSWPLLLRHLGRARPRWAFLLGQDGDWPPRTAPC